MTEWFIQDGNTAKGPVSERQLVELAKSGQLTLLTYIFSPTKTKEWITAETVPALAAIINKNSSQHTRQTKNNAETSSSSSKTNPVAPTQSLNPDSGMAVLIVSIIGIFVPILPFVAWVFGNKYITNSRSKGLEPGSAGIIGRVIGIIFSILDLLAVVVAVAVVALSIYSVNQIQRLTQGDAAVTQIGTLKQASRMFKLNIGRYPASLNELVTVPPGLSPQAWKGPYLDEGRLPTDPWGNPFNYSADELADIVTITSNGPDGQMGTADDIGAIPRS